VKLSDGDIIRIAAFLKLSEFDFIQEYTRLGPNRASLALNEQPDGACIFLDGINCSINPVKPEQCAGFPNTWNFPGWQNVCEAKPIENE
jgi:Fe-S-cluster containining protein